MEAMQLGMNVKDDNAITTAQRAPSPCPCRSKECLADYKAHKEAYERLLTAKAKGELPDLHPPRKS